MVFPKTIKTIDLKNLYSNVTLKSLVLGATVTLCACGGSNGDSSSSSSSSSGSQAGTTPISITRGGSNRLQAQFELPEADKDLVEGSLSVPAERTKSDKQAELAAPISIYPFPDLWRFKDLLPHPELYCDQPLSPEFEKLASELGGFHKTARIYIEHDATRPLFYSGFLNNIIRTPSAPPEDASSPGVTIQRPNIVGKKGSKTFYLSDNYGLITVDYGLTPTAPAKVSCALPIPGTPKNFVVTEKHLFVLTQDMRGMSAAVLQFDITSDDPTFVGGLVFENQNLIDARLFNDTLALYLSTYQVTGPTPPLPEPGPRPGGASVDILPGPLLPPRELINHELKVLDTLPTLKVSHTEVFLPEGHENPASNSQAELEKVRSWSYFNRFISASGNYLVLSKRINEQHFTGYQTRTSYRCTHYKKEEYPYRYCSTKWKRIENPSYKPAPQGGVLTCAGSLRECIKTQVPNVSQYIYVADGRECHDTTRVKYTCTQGQNVSWEVPQYRRETHTQFYAFRFDDGEFIRLDDHLAQVEKNTIHVGKKPFRIPGAVQKHDHINFNDDILYAISHDYNTKQYHLNTMSVIGNSAVHIDDMVMKTDTYYANLSAIFTADTLYLSNGSSRKGSNMSTISLANPIKPAVSGSVKIPTVLEQLLFADQTLIGVGRSSTKIGVNNGTRTFGTVTGFDKEGKEQSNLILGGDYRYYSSRINSDDQVLTLDAKLKRLLVPYTVSRPLLGDQAVNSQNRVTIASYDTGQITEEGTVSLPHLPERTLSIDQDTAFAFSDEFIHQMTKPDQWQSTAIFDGELPKSIYYSRLYDNHVQKRIRPEEFEFRLVDSPDGAAGMILDRVTVKRSLSNICTYEQVYFDRDRVLIVQEKAGLYTSHQDCPNNRKETQKIYTGYRIGKDTLTAIEDQKELQDLYRKIQWGMICVLDITNKQGQLVETKDVPQTAKPICYTGTEFYQKSNQL